MNKDQVKGRVEQVKGKIKKVTGSVVGNKSLEQEGKAQEIVRQGRGRYWRSQG